MDEYNTFGNYMGIMDCEHIFKRKRRDTAMKYLISKCSKCGGYVVTPVDEFEKDLEKRISYLRKQDTLR